MFNKINQSNSNIVVQCNAKGKCEMRFTELCKICKHNCGKQKDKNYYKPIGGKKNVII